MKYKQKSKINNNNFCRISARNIADTTRMEAANVRLETSAFIFTLMQQEDTLMLVHPEGVFEGRTQTALRATHKASLFGSLWNNGNSSGSRLKI